MVTRTRIYTHKKGIKIQLKSKVGVEIRKILRSVPAPGPGFFALATPGTVRRGIEEEARGVFFLSVLFILLASHTTGVTFQTPELKSLFFIFIYTRFLGKTLREEKKNRGKRKIL